IRISARVRVLPPDDARSPRDSWRLWTRAAGPCPHAPLLYSPPSNLWTPESKLCDQTPKGLSELRRHPPPAKQGVSELTIQPTTARISSTISPTSPDSSAMSRDTATERR